MADIEQHPLKPFTPQHARLLMLGSFPPARNRWSMDFFYPNFQNDMWRIYGLCFFDDKDYFVDVEHKSFRKEQLVEFLTEKGVALYDTASAVIRTKGTAADKDLEVVTPTDLDALLRRMPECQAVVVTGQKAADVFTSHFQIVQPKVGAYTEFFFDGHPLRFYRMPSSSRAYPMKLERKAAAYQQMFAELGLIRL
jgi:G:T/U-mismatch repair DNA glycosylase